LVAIYQKVFSGIGFDVIILRYVS